MEEARLQLWKTSDKTVTKVYFTVRSQGVMHSVIHPHILCNFTAGKPLSNF